MVRLCTLIPSKLYLKKNSKEYLKIMSDNILPCNRESYGPNKFLLVQDCASAWSKKVQTYLKKHLPMFVSKNIWRIMSTDSNMCENWLFRLIKKKSNAASHLSFKSLNTLNTALLSTFQSLDNE